MEKRLKIFSYLTIILLVIVSIWVVFNFTMYQLLQPKVVGLEPLGNLEQWADLIWIGYLVFFLFHPIAFLTYIFHLQLYRKINFFKILILVIGIISFFAVFGNWSIMGDIGKEYKEGWDTSSEWPFLYVFLFLHTSFFILLYPFIFSTLRKLKQGIDSEPPKKDEVVFKMAQYVGIVCGLMGLSMISMQLLLRVPLWHIKLFGMITSVLLLLPYALIVGYWFLIKSREKISEWYDEKQWQDVSRSGFITLVLSVIIMLLLFIITFNTLPGGIFGILWMPFYIFIVLLIFSASTLYYHSKG